MPYIGAESVAGGVSRCGVAAGEVVVVVIVVCGGGEVW